MVFSILDKYVPAAKKVESQLIRLRAGNISLEEYPRMESEIIGILDRFLERRAAYLAAESIENSLSYPEKRIYLLSGMEKQLFIRTEGVNFNLLKKSHVERIKQRGLLGCFAIGPYFSRDSLRQGLLQVHLFLNDNGFEPERDSRIHSFFSCFGKVEATVGLSAGYCESLNLSIRLMA